MKQSHLSRMPRLKRGAKAELTTITGLALLAGAIISPPVLAGEYVLDRIETADGTVYESESTPTTRPWANNWPNSASSQKSSIASQTGYSVSAKSKGKVRAVFKWQPQEPGDNPPQDGVLAVKVTSYTNVPASITYGNPAGTLSGLVVDNGFGAPITNTNYGTSYNYTSQGTHLVQVKTNGQTEVKIPYILMHGAATISGTTGNTSSSSASAGAYLSYQAEKDTRNRGVWIESPTIEDSFFKPQDSLPPNPPAAPEKNERDPDMQIKLDSAIYWDESVGKWKAEPLIKGVTPGFQNPQRVWTYSGNRLPTPNTVNQILSNPPSFTLNMEFGTDPKLGAPFSSFSEFSSFKLKVTDDDGAQGENFMFIKWHLPIENWRELTEAQGAPGETYVEFPLECDPADGAEPLHSVTGTLEPVPWTATGIYHAQGIAVAGATGAGAAWIAGTAIGGAAGSPTGPGALATAAVGGFIAYLGTLIVSDEPEPTLTQPQQSTLAKWNSAVNYTLSHTNDAQIYPEPNPNWTEAERDSLYNGSKMVLYRRVWTKNHLFYGDKYGVHGYEGRGWQNLEILSRDEIIPFFNYSSEPANP